MSEKGEHEKAHAHAVNLDALFYVLREAKATAELMERKVKDAPPVSPEIVEQVLVCAKEAGRHLRKALHHFAVYTAEQASGARDREKKRRP